MSKWYDRCWTILNVSGSRLLACESIKSTWKRCRRSEWFLHIGTRQGMCMSDFSLVEIRKIFIKFNDAKALLLPKQPELQEQLSWSRVAASESLPLMEIVAAPPRRLRRRITMDCEWSLDRSTWVETAEAKSLTADRRTLEVSRRYVPSSGKDTWTVGV